MYLRLVAWFLALVSVGAQSNSKSLTSSLVLANPSTTECNATCTRFQEMDAKCTTPHCGCTVPYLLAQGNCFVCLSDTPGGKANVQILLDEEMNQCRRDDKVNLNVRLDLPPAAAAIIQKFQHDSATLRRLQTVYFALQITGGHIGLVVVLAFSAFSNCVRYEFTFVNFCTTWIFSSIVFSIMLYRGTNDNNVADALGEVQPSTCVAQAALTEAAQVMTACSTLALIIQLWFSLRAVIHGDPTPGVKRTLWMKCALFVTPYMLFIAFALPAVFVGMDHTSLQDVSLPKALPGRFYCVVIRSNSSLNAVCGVTLALLTITVIFDALIIRLLYKNWRAFRQVQAKSAVSLSVLLRVMVFSIYRVAVAVAYVSVLSRLPTLNTVWLRYTLPSLDLIPIWVDMLQAAIPLVAFLVFGVNSNLIRSIMFWRWFHA